MKIIKQRNNRVNELGEMLSLRDATPIFRLWKTSFPDRTLQVKSNWGCADNFMPLLGESTEFSIKWSNLCDYQISEGISDAVVAYEYMHNFYVEEGNKRVSVMKYLKSYSIPTVVTRILPKKTDDKQVKIYYEYLPFYEVTGIFGFVFSEPGCYTRLASQLGQDLETPWPEELVSNFEDAYDKFARIFQSRGERSGLRAEDAFLIYLTMFPLERLL